MLGPAELFGQLRHFVFVLGDNGVFGLHRLFQHACTVLEGCTGLFEIFDLVLHRVLIEGHLLGRLFQAADCAFEFDLTTLGGAEGFRTGIDLVAGIREQLFKHFIALEQGFDTAFIGTLLSRSGG